MALVSLACVLCTDLLIPRCVAELYQACAFPTPLFSLHKVFSPQVLNWFTISSVPAYPRLGPEGPGETENRMNSRPLLISPAVISSYRPDSRQIKMTLLTLLSFFMELLQPLFLLIVFSVRRTVLRGNVGTGSEIDMLYVIIQGDLDDIGVARGTNIACEGNMSSYVRRPRWEWDKDPRGLQEGSLAARLASDAQSGRIDLASKDTVSWRFPALQYSQLFAYPQGQSER
ncbi:uncharacterized protein MKK02DRAFT_31086 [Dioszegia hungarica]|uniref:Uncharacterized protein n=1 Tax=Dioszegia hungarica TaxID=4972 RepID=A0AA38LYC4_9TREE|nr:uncharacterized protein MKK02DRAFT_31086 [Dioszegia hungarica]KAI9638761.1 hypothetical protein MKK02DRAFT_31086 [Dioszegia hungarica]